MTDTGMNSAGQGWVSSDLSGHQSHPKYAVFVEPDGALREFIAKWKKRVNAALPNQPYCGHPPHATLLVAFLQPPENWLKALETALARIRPFRIKTAKSIVFYDDPLSCGGHTLALGVEPSAELRGLQQSVADTLSPFLDKVAIQQPTGPMDKEPFLTSCSRYGFPFVGPHWIPHFSIASVRTARDHALVSDFLRTPPNYELNVKHVSVWRVAGDAHRRLAIVKLV